MTDKDQLDRIERKLDELLAALSSVPGTHWPSYVPPNTNQAPRVGGAS